MTTLINLTPHAVSIADADGNVIRTLAPQQQAARVSADLTPLRPVDGIPFALTVFGIPINLPDPSPDTYYIVSQIVISACPHRTDLVRPDTGSSAIRDADGRIIAVRGLTR